MLSTDPPKFTHKTTTQKPARSPETGAGESTASTGPFQADYTPHGLVFNLQQQAKAKKKTVPTVMRGRPLSTTAAK